MIKLLYLFSGERTRSPWLMSQSNLEHVVMISPRAASSTTNHMYISMRDEVIAASANILVFPVSRHATFAHVSWLSTSHFFKLRMTRLRSWNEVFAHSFCASYASAIFFVISVGESARTVSRWYAVAGS